MCRKRVHSMVACLVLALASSSMAGLVGHWALDDGAGTIVRDSTANGNDGQLIGDPQWVDGVIAGALQFDGVGDYVEVPHDPVLAIEGQVTVAVWINAERHTGPGGSQWQGILAKGGNPRLYSLYTEARGVLHFSTGPGGAYIGSLSTGQVPLNEWVHVAVVVDSGHQYYLNGEPAGQGGQGATAVGGGTAPLTIGKTNEANEFLGMIDDVRLYDRALTPEQVQGIFSGNPPIFGKAEVPDPPDGAEGVLTPLLQWTPGETAVFHDVYFGTSPELTEADRVSTQQTFTIYYHTPGLEPGVTYYWRVDEIEVDMVTIHTGDVWSFTAAPTRAYAPYPPDGASQIALDVELAWSPASGGISRNVYFGTNLADVEAGTGDTFKGKLQVVTTFDPGDLEGETVYYWRIDEIDGNGDVMAGDVWSFRTMPDIPISDPNLVGWWRLDDAFGDMALDWSGYGNHGSLQGDPQWVVGYDGGALQLDGTGDFVEVPHDDTLTVDNEVTAMAWINAASLTGPGGSDYQGIVAKGNAVRSYSLYLQSAGTLHFSTTSGGAYVGSSSSGTVALNEWTHVAAQVVDGGHEYFINGEPAGQGGSGIILPGLADTYTVRIGTTQESAREFNGMIDDVRIYRAALTQEEIREAMQGDPKLASDPQPLNGANVDIRDAASLSWSSGDAAAQHDVYFGADGAAVLEADADSALYRGRQTATGFSLAGLVEFGGGDYYWRIDEVEADGLTVHKGRVWIFTVPDYFIVDDFESYTNEVGQRVFEKWVDGIGYTLPEPGDPGNGTGALVGHDIWSADSPYFGGSIMETDNVHGGDQALPLYYDNTAQPYVSAAERTWTTAQDWTAHGVTDLSLWFRGNPPAFVENAPDSFSLSAAGTDIWDLADEFRYAYKQLNGNGSIVARVDSLEQTHPWAKAGVMIRETLEPGSKHATVAVTPSNGVAFQRRLFTGNSSVSTAQTGVVAPHWIRLTRTGNTFKAEHSADGLTWEDVGADPDASSEEITMTGNVYVGLCLTSHDPAAVAIAEFSGVQTTGALGQWQIAEIGVDHPENSSEDLYVTLEDSFGRTASVSYPQGATIHVWSPWRIPLADFTGVSLGAVRKVSLGVGNVAAPAAGGTGVVYFDDIHVARPAPVEPNDVATE